MRTDMSGSQLAYFSHVFKCARSQLYAEERERTPDDPLSPIAWQWPAFPVRHRIRRNDSVVINTAVRHRDAVPLFSSFPSTCKPTCHKPYLCGIFLTSELFFLCSFSVDVSRTEPTFTATFINNASFILELLILTIVVIEYKIFYSIRYYFRRISHYSSWQLRNDK